MIQYLLSIDPGRNTGKSNQGTGLGYFVNGVLQVAAKGEPDFGEPHLVQYPAPDVVVIEQPRWYPKKREIDLNDLLDLAVLVGRYAGRFEHCSDVELVYPRDWKGTIPPDICNERVLEALTEKERARLPRRPRAKDVDHNVLDGVGIGLWKLGRFG